MILTNISLKKRNNRLSRYFVDKLFPNDFSFFDFKRSPTTNYQSTRLDLSFIPHELNRPIFPLNFHVMNQTLLLWRTSITILKVSKCGYAVLVMAIYWCTDAIPLAITSLLPVAMLPMLGILTSNQVCGKYIKVWYGLFLLTL